MSPYPQDRATQDKVHSPSLANTAPTTHQGQSAATQAACGGEGRGVEECGERREERMSWIQVSEDHVRYTQTDVVRQCVLADVYV